MEATGKRSFLQTEAEIANRYRSLKHVVQYMMAGQGILELVMVVKIGKCDEFDNNYCGDADLC